jgi:hypothetical protein
MLHVYGGALRYYDQWFRLNVVDGEERLVVAGRGTNRHYFKFGVFALHGVAVEGCQGLHQNLFFSQ